MHKEMNTIKWGNTYLKIYWIDIGADGPMKLMNRDNAAAAALGGQAAADRAEEVSQAGGVKLTSLAGAVFAHKDKKKGQQDSLRYYLESTVGYMTRFPDTSNTRYQSHCDAAAELLVRLPFYREYLEVIRDLKDSGTWTNIELNVYNGLHDIPTLTELCVLALYAQAILHPYMRLVRGSQAAETNLLDLGPLHDKVKTHCRAIIANSNLLLATDASYTTGAMDGKVWERSDAFYAVKALAPSLPHLPGALVAFFRGALEGWERFSTEFAPDGQIATATSAERQQAFMLPTNDHNESGLSEKRRVSSYAPTMALEQHNARRMYRKNDTRSFIKFCLGVEDRQYLKQRVRDEEKEGLPRKRREEQAASYKEAREAKRLARENKAAAEEAKRKKMAEVVPRLDPEDIRRTPGTCVDLDLQLEWHRMNGDCEVPKKSQVGRKEQKVEALIAAVERHNGGNMRDSAEDALHNARIQLEGTADTDDDDSDMDS